MILPDILVPGLKAVFCGTAPGNISAARNAYYAAESNKFWEIIFKAGFTPELMLPSEFREAVRYGIGFTDMAKEEFGVDKQLSKKAFDSASLRQKILKYQPRALCFTSKKAAQEFFCLKSSAALHYGLQQETIKKTVIFVLPSTSAAAIRWWNEEYWLAAGSYVKNL